jgi:hypothetical protein
MSEAKYHADRLTKRRRHPTVKKARAQSWRDALNWPTKRPWGKRSKGPAVEYSTGPEAPTLGDILHE